MIQLHKLRIEEFRGIRKLELKLDGKSLVVAGPNGSGKSGVVDAIDFVLTGNVARLSGAGTGGISVTKHEQTAAATDLADLEQRTRDALDLLEDSHQTYQRATEAIRKQLNHALFARVLLGFEPTQIRVEFNKPYDTLTAH